MSCGSACSLHACSNSICTTAQHSRRLLKKKKPVGKQLQDMIESALTAPNGASLKPKGPAFCFPRRSNPEDIADLTLEQIIFSKEFQRNTAIGSEVA